MTREEAIKLLGDDGEIPCMDECCASFICEECKFYQALHMALDALKEEIPHGEWIEERDKSGHLISRKCPFCKAYYDGMLINFCPNCGARMKEGEEK